MGSQNGDGSCTASYTEPYANGYNSNRDHAIALLCGSGKAAKVHSVSMQGMT